MTLFGQAGSSPAAALDIEMAGRTQGIPDGGFRSTNRDTVALGVVLSVTGLRDAGERPEDIIAALKTLRTAD
jgi:hypothetical protein